MDDILVHSLRVCRISPSPSSSSWPMTHGIPWWPQRGAERLRILRTLSPCPEDARPIRFQQWNLQAFGGNLHGIMGEMAPPARWGASGRSIEPPGKWSLWLQWWTTWVASAAPVKVTGDPPTRQLTSTDPARNFNDRCNLPGPQRVHFEGKMWPEPNLA